MDTPSTNYADINGISMYYEQYGSSTHIPLVLLHGGASTIQTSFGRVIDQLSKTRKVIAVELQAHGRTSDREGPISFIQDAEDVATLLRFLNVAKADFFGFSNGGNTAIQIAIRHPQLCHKIIAGSALLKRNGTFPQFWEFIKQGTFEQMPQAYKDAFLAVTPDHAKLMNMYLKCAQRIQNLQDIPDENLQAIACPVLLINGDRDVATSDHIVAMSKTIPNCRIAIIPGGHGEYIGEITTLQPNFKPEHLITGVLMKFLDSEPQK